MIIDRPAPEQLPSLRGLWKEVFGDTDEFLDIFFRTAFSPDRCRILTVNDETAAALYWFDCIFSGEPIAYLYAVATAESHRGQGLCSRLMADTHAHLASRGYKGAILVPGSGSLFRFYERMGYRTCSSIQEFTCTASDKAVPLTPLSRAEYTSLRRTMLPENAVLQEKENIDFLITQAELYKGDGFLIAARREKDNLVCTELLGAPSSAPMITKALGCTSGKFRTPPRPDKDSRPFAMYLSFTGESAPSYFGLAFD